MLLNCNRPRVHNGTRASNAARSRVPFRVVMSAQVQTVEAEVETVTTEIPSRPSGGASRMGSYSDSEDTPTLMSTTTGSDSSSTDPGAPTRPGGRGGEGRIGLASALQKEASFTSPAVDRPGGRGGADRMASSSDEEELDNGGNGGNANSGSGDNGGNGGGSGGGAGGSGDSPRTSHGDGMNPFAAWTLVFGGLGLFAGLGEVLFGKKKAKTTLSEATVSANSNNQPVKPCCAGKTSTTTASSSTK